MERFFISKSPKSEVLSQFISHYYFHKSTELNQKLDFHYYPNTKNALTIYANSKVEIIDGAHSRTLPNDEGLTIQYSHLFNQIGRAEIIGPFRKVGIVFEPLGLNHFVEQNLGKVIKQGVNLDFSYFGTPFEAVLEEVFATEDVSLRVKLLDDFFCSALLDFQDVRFKEIITYLNNDDSQFSVDTIANREKINRKTLLRLFNKHLDCTPKDYISLIQFRKAVELFHKNEGDGTLTEIALDSNYYDQSSFIKHFRKKTGFNPKSFFNKLTQYGKHSTFWIKD